MARDAEWTVRVRDVRYSMLTFDATDARDADDVLTVR